MQGLLPFLLLDLFLAAAAAAATFALHEKEPWKEAEPCTCMQAIAFACKHLHERHTAVLLPLVCVCVCVCVFAAAAPAETGNRAQKTGPHVCVCV